MLNGDNIYVSLRNFTSSRSVYLIAFLWGFFEATFFFIVPDVYFCFIALFSPLCGITLCLVSVLGSVPGGMIMYRLAEAKPVAINNFLEKIPGISAQMIELVHSDFQKFGIKALFLGPTKGIPYKIFSTQAGITHMDFARFILASFPARLERILLVAIIAALIGFFFRENIRKYSKIWIISYLFLWLSIYLAYGYMLNIKAQNPRW